MSVKPQFSDPDIKIANTGGDTLMSFHSDAPAPGRVGLSAGLVADRALSNIPAVSSVGRGEKRLSNLNLVLSLILPGTFVVLPRS